MTGPHDLFLSGNKPLCISDVIAGAPCPTISPDDDLYAVVDAMRDSQAGAAGVTGLNRMFLGLVTERDLLYALADLRRRDEKSPRVLRARDIMISNPLCLNPAAPVKAAFDVMVRCGHRFMPVVQDGRLLGMMDSRILLSLVQDRMKTQAKNQDSLLTYFMHHEPYGGGPVPL